MVSDAPAYGILFAILIALSSQMILVPDCMKPKLLAILVILLFAPPTLAQTGDLYSGEAIVENQQPSERRRAMPLALKQVVQKLSGLRNFEDYPELEPALANASDMVVSFHYRNLEKTLSDGSNASELHLVSRFSKPEVDQLIAALQLPLWRPERDPAHVWVVVDDGLGRRIMPLELQYAWDAMDDAARQRGLEIIWPQADEEGNFGVHPQLLWGGYTEDVGAGDKAAVLVAAARREGREWSVRVKLEYAGEAWTWRDDGMDVEWTMTETMQHAVDEIAAANTIVAADRGRWLHEISVRGVGGAEDYARCLGYLQSLSVVEQVRVIGAEPGMVRFGLVLNALPGYLDQALAGGETMEPTDDESNYLLLR
jgi:hypothetical protein